ncbi:uncharacterized protein LOC62_02G002694 [Vanrija pseudolonga]|uniref:Uncharacterized protein n=1 Tax=Vanrija pseudolonga TaxID=143232 RepID=A0AAF0Y6I7_9TREE|nr:hypothetical protein LOC62_02G002694 [Vanrija pseudolonga]
MPPSRSSTLSVTSLPKSPSVSSSPTEPGSLSPTVTATSDTPPNPSPSRSRTMSLPEVGEAGNDQAAGAASNPQLQDLATLMKEMSAKMDGLATQTSITSLNRKLDRIQQTVDSVRSIAIASALHARNTNTKVTAILEILSRLDTEPVVEVVL